jgi:hypothetical protein
MIGRYFVFSGKFVFGKNAKLAISIHFQYTKFATKSESKFVNAPFAQQKRHCGDSRSGP